MNTNKTVTRREFLKIAGMTAGAATLAACTPQVVTQIVQQTVVSQQTQIVQQTVVNQVQVTPTPVPPITTPQGRVLPPDAASLDKQIMLDEPGAEPQHFDGPRDIYHTGGLLLINETLIHSDQDMVTVPSLAESWKAGPNTTYWEFTIQQGAIWSDDTPITSDDVVFTFQHLANPAIANPWVWFYFPIKGVSEVSGGKDVALINDPKTGGVRKVDDRTVRLYGEGPSADGDPCPYMPALLSYQAAVFVPKHIAEKDELHWADNGVGLVSGGPFICSAWEHNAKITYDINPKYNRPMKPGIQKHIGVIAPATGFNAFNSWLNQEYYLIHAMSPANVAAVRADPKLNPLMHFFSNFQTEYMVLNTFMPPLDNLKVRQALSHAIDRATLCSSVLNGTYTPAFSMLPPGFPAYNPDLAPIQAFDIAAAQSILADAGWKGGKNAAGVQMSLDLYDVSNDPKNLFVKQQWETNLGIKVNLKEVEAGVWSDMRAKHTMMVYKGPYEYDYVDPANLLTQLFRSTPNPPAGTDVTKWGSPRHPWYNADYDKLCDAGAVETDVAKRIKDYQDAEKIQVTDCGQIFITHQIIFQVWWPWLILPPDKTGNTVYRWLDITQFQMYISKDVDALKAQYKNA
jgi:oligopeptide transport system substrate-binding protein